MKRTCSILALLLAIPAVSQASVIGDFVWEDTNGNGIQEPGEPGVAGVTVSLWTMDTSNSPDSKIGTVTTDSGGLYSFTGVDAGNYFVEFELPTAYDSFTGARLGNDPTVDSDPVGASGFTDFLTISANEVDPTIDAGLICDVPGSCSSSGQAPVPTPLALLGLGFAGIRYWQRKQIKAA